MGHMRGSRGGVLSLKVILERAENCDNSDGHGLAGGWMDACGGDGDGHRLLQRVMDGLLGKERRRGFMLHPCAVV